MADAPAFLSAHIIAELRKLAGRAKVTRPSAHASYTRVERVLNRPIGDWQLDYDTPDEEYTSALLKEQVKLGGDDHNVEVYRRYETLPGYAIVSTSLNDRGETVVTTTQAIAPGTVTPAAGLGVEVDSVETISAVEAQHTRSVATRGTYTSRRFDGSLALGAKVDEVITSITPGSGSDVLPAINASNVLDAEIQHTTTGEKKLRITRLASGESQPIRVSWEYNERLRSYVKVEKQVVNTSAVPSSAPSITTGSTSTGAQIIEYQPVPGNKDLAIWIKSTFPTGSVLSTKTATHPITIEYPFPSILRSASFKYGIAISGDGKVIDYDVGLDLKIDPARRKFRALITEYFTYAPQSLITSLGAGGQELEIITKAELIPAVNWATSLTSARIALQNFQVPPTIRNEIAIGLSIHSSAGTVATGSAPTYTLSASTPSLSEIEGMQYIVVDVDVKPYVGGVYIVTVTKLINPYYNP